MVKPCVSQHFPYDRVTPIVRGHLRVDLDSIVVMSCLKDLGHGQQLVHGDADEVLPELLERDLEGSLVIFTLAHSVADDAVSVADKEQDSAGIYTIQSSNISDRIGVDKDQCEFTGIKNLVFTRCEESLGA